MSASFEQLMKKVVQAEDALEAQERRVAADLRQLKVSWVEGWTPGRIVLAGLASGFLIGRVEPAKSVAKGSTIMQMLSMLSGLMATATAHTAADKADQAATTAEDVAATTEMAIEPPEAAHA